MEGWILYFWDKTERKRYVIIADKRPFLLLLAAVFASWKKRTNCGKHAIWYADEGEKIFGEKRTSRTRNAVWNMQVNELNVFRLSLDMMSASKSGKVFRLWGKGKIGKIAESAKFDRT